MTKTQLAISIWTLIISILGVAVAGGFTIFVAFKNSKLQKELQQKQIAADLKASARIQWIQEVRKQTAKLISAHQKLWITSYNFSEVAEARAENEKQKVYAEFLEEAILLELYFANKPGKKKLSFAEDRGKNFYKESWEQQERGNPQNEKITKAKENNKPLWNILFNDENNDGKEELIVSLIEDIKNNPAEKGKKDNPCSRYLASVETSHKNQITQNNLGNLSKIISIYLKIEWDRAKNGE